MQVDALGLSQEMDFADQSVTNFLTIRLPSGDIVKALVSDAAVERIAANLASMQTGTPVAPPPVPVVSVPPVVQYEQLQQSSEGLIFGGPPIPEATPRQKILRVEADSRGNPIVHRAGGPSALPEDKLGGGPDQDEDGIGQG